MSSLSTFIQFFAALYLTMSIDHLFGTYFWSPSHYKSIDNILTKSKVPDVNKKTILAQAQKVENDEIRQSRKKGTFWLSICLLLLVYSSFEIDTILLVDIYILNITVTIAFIIYLLSVYLMKKWRCVYLLLGGLVVIFCLIKIITFDMIPTSTSIDIRNSNIHLNILRWTIIISITIPVIMQLLRNWLYTNGYLTYVAFNVHKCVNDYNAARAFKPEGNISSIAKEYQDAVGHKVSHAKTEDDFIHTISNTLSQKLSEQTAIPTLWILIKTSVSKSKYQIHESDSIDYAEMLSVGVDEDNKSGNEEDDKELEPFYQEYIKRKPLPKIVTFCKEKHIEETHFRALYNKKIEGKKK